MSKRLPPISPNQLRTALNYFGALVLVVGFISAALVWRASERSPEAGDERLSATGPLAASDSRKQSREIEIYYGKTGLLMERWREGMEGLSHGKPLAKLIVVVSSITGVGCFLLATRLPV